MIFIVCLRILEIHVRCRENRSYPAKLMICAADSVLTLHVSSPHPLRKRSSSPRSCVFHYLSFSILSQGFERRRTCWYCVRLFYLFSSHKFYNFKYLRIPFFSFLSFLPFFSTYYNSQLLAHFFHRPQLCSSVGFINRDYLLVCFSFHSSQSSRNLRLLTTHIPPYSPKVVVLMLILSTLGWCPLHVISSKISVFLSTDSQSTGSLTFLVSHDSVCSPQSSQHSSSYKAKELPPCLGDIIGAYCRKRQS